MSKHKVRTHHWIDGILSFVEQEFESLAEAKFFAETSLHHNAKIFNEENVVVYHVVKGSEEPFSTYA